ncbi:hypothetical protein [Microvirga arsenatis]|uniref:Glycosyltransferase RgtA/B/C/D-like domain-containing protein n=1 Tax=Microvirga arsenatis TaxID=2692265 RepID=A0ABW9YZP3_9HYPH|nr:hypothetical protein [Microvirga arsenatis]NBJ11437.1 hypothetical protein [Microvirga arsenatis]NBJ25710.1 hypothetical protein [Microvirga arsenatis]
MKHSANLNLNLSAINLGALVIVVGTALAALLKLPETKLIKPYWTSQQVWASLAAIQLLWYFVAAVSACFILRILTYFFRINFIFSLFAFAFLTIFALSGLSATLSVVAFLGAAFLLGAFASSLILEERNPPAAQLIAIGLAVYGIALSIAARFPINSRTFYSILCIFPLVFLAHTPTRAFCRTWIQGRATSLRTQKMEFSWRETLSDIGLVVLVTALGIHLLYTLLPERYHDALAVHLYIPSYILAHGRWSFDASTWVFAHMPLTVDFLYTMLFGLGGEEATRLFNFAVLILISSIMLRTMEPFTGRTVAIWTVVLFVTTPLTFIETAALFVENTLTLWITAAAAILMSAWRSINVRHSIPILILLAAAVSAKLHGVVAAFLVGSSLFAGLALKHQTPREWRAFALVVTLAGGAASIPYVHAWLDTGNPVFPFFNAIFHSPLWPSVNFVDPRYAGKFDWSLLWNTTFRSSSYLEAADGALGLGILLLFPVGMYALLIRHKPQDILAFVIGVGFLVIIASQSQYLRYFYPALPVVFFLLGRGMEYASTAVAGRFLVPIIVGIAVLFNLYLMPSAGWILWDTDFRAAFDQQARWNLETDQVPERLANKLINELAGPNARVFYTFDPFGALLEGTALSSSWYNTKYSTQISNIATGEQFRKLLDEMNVNYVVHRANLEIAYIRAMDEYLRQRARKIAQIGQVSVYEVRRRNK